MSRLRTIAIALGLAVGSCAAVPDPDQPAPASPPDREQFVMKDGVNDFMERRCGGLDCHGQIGRPLRIYSSLGLRKTNPKTPFADRPTTATTMDEKVDNYLSVVNLEPEAIGYAHETKGEYRDFLLLKKPLGLENNGVRHKGGPVLREVGEPGYQCLLSWISGAVSTKDCRDATF